MCRIYESVNTVDSSSPPAPIISPVASPTKNASFAISFTKQGSGDGTFRFKLNNSDLSTGATVTTSSSYSGTFPQGLNTFYVQQRNALGTWGSSASVSFVVDTAPPAAPSSFTASWVPVPGQIRLQIVHGAGLSDYAQIKIVRGMGNSGPGCDATAPNIFVDWNVNVSNTAYTDAGLVPGTQYTYEFCAEDAAGNRTVSAGTSALAGTYSIFTTDALFNGNLKAGVGSHPAAFDSGLFGADYRCQEEAATANRAGFYRAIIGDKLTGVAQRIKANGRISPADNGTQIALNESGLYSGTTIGLGGNRLRNGLTSSAFYSWTGSNSDGMPTSSPPDCLGWTSPSGSQFGQAGDLATASQTYWMSFSPFSCNSSYPLRCIYQDEPGLSSFSADLLSPAAGDVNLKLGFPFGVTSYSSVYDRVEIRAKLDDVPNGNCTGAGERVVYTYSDASGDEPFPSTIGAEDIVLDSVAKPLERWGYRACLWDKQATPQLITSHAIPVVRVKAPATVGCHDSFVNLADSLNYATQTLLKVSEYNPAYESYLRFDLSSFPASLNGVNDVLLELTLNVSNIAADRQISANSVTAPWSEGTLTGSNMPGFIATPLGTMTVSSAAPLGSKLQLSLFSLFSNWLAGSTQNHGIRLSGSPTWAVGEVVTFESQDSANPSGRPALRFSFVGGEPVQVVQCQ